MGRRWVKAVPEHRARGIFPRRRLVLPGNGDAGHQRVPVQAASRQTIPRYPALRSGVQWTARDDSAGMS